MAQQDQSPQPKPKKRYAATITVPETKAAIFQDVARGRRISKISRSHRTECAAIEQIVADGIREMRATAALPRFRGETRDGWGKRKPMGGAVVSMPVRIPERAA